MSDRGVEHISTPALVIDTSVQEVQKERFDIMVGGKKVGYISCFYEEDGSTRLNYGIDAKEHGKGYMYAVLKKLMSHIPEKYTSFVCYVERNNVASAKLLTKLGFSVVDSEAQTLVFQYPKQ